MTTSSDSTPSSPEEEKENLVVLPPHPSGVLSSSAAEAMLPLALSAAVPLWISSIYEQGGPTQEDWARLPQLGQQIAEQGDHLLYPSPREGETAELFNTLAQLLALCSFVPGGISFGEQHFDARKTLTFFLGAEKAEQYVREARRRAVSGGTA
jgi:hypothetical protein